MRSGTSSRLSHYDLPERSYCTALCATATSIGTGLVVGGFVTASVGCSLAEISISDGFSFAFGCIIIVTGLLLCARIAKLTDAPKFVIRLVTVFAFLLVLSGALCFVLNKNIVKSLPWHAKIPMYALLSTTLTFCLAFSIVDILNVTHNCIFPGARESGSAAAAALSAGGGIVQSKRQIVIIFVASLVIGCVMGLVFGTLDVEDDDYHVTRMREEQLFSVPLGAIAGAIIGFTNLFLNEQVEASGVLYGFDSLGIQDDI